MPGTDGAIYSTLLLVAMAPGLMLVDVAMAQSQSNGGTSTSAASATTDSLPNSGGTRAHPNGNPGDWVTDNDYPVASLKSNVAGLVRFRLTIAPDGTPSACEIVGTSNDATLDQTTCTLLMRRAHFFPATDAAGKPVIGVFRSSVLWQIPRPAPEIPSPGNIVIAFDVNLDGSIANCTGRVTEGLAATYSETYIHDRCARLVRYARPRDAAGKPIMKHIEFVTGVTVADVP